MSRIKTVIFDKDNTLIDLEAYCRRPIIETAKHIAKSAGKANDGKLIEQLCAVSGLRNGKLVDESPEVWGSNADVIYACKEFMIAKGLPVENEEEWISFLADSHVKYGDVRALPGVLTAVQWLRDYGIRLCLVTSDHYRSAIKCLNELGIESCFDVIIAADTFKAQKPSPRIADEICEKLNVERENLMMVGDSTTDMMFAKNSNITGVYYAKQKMQIEDAPSGTDYIIYDMTQVIDLISTVVIS